jgi:hypothetical protein
VSSADERNARTARTGVPSSEVDGYIHQILEDDAARAARNRAQTWRRRSWSRGLLFLCVPLLAFSTAWNLMRMYAQPPAFTVEQHEDAARFAVYLVARQLEDHWERTGRLPQSLTAIDPEEERVEYTVDGSTYILSADTPTGVLLYRRGEDLAPFAEPARGLVGGL